MLMLMCEHCEVADGRRFSDQGSIGNSSLLSQFTGVRQCSFNPRLLHLGKSLFRGIGVMSFFCI